MAATADEKTQAPEAEQSQESLGDSLKDILQSAQHLAGIEAKLLVLHTKLTIQRIVMFIILAIIAAGLCILGVIFLAIGLYHLMIRVMPPHCAYLMVAAPLLIAAAVLLLYARAVLRRKQ